MRILLLVYYYAPKPQSCGRVMHDLGVALLGEGHEVVVLTPDDTLQEKLSIAEEDGLTVVRVRSGAFQGVSKPRRALNEWRLPSLLWRRAGGFLRDHPCDLVVNYSPTIFFGPLVRRLKRRWRCRTYLVLRDIFPQWAVDLGLMRRGSPAHRFLRHYELLLYDAADVIALQSERNRDYFVAEGLAERHHLEVLHNWSPSGGLKVAPSRFREELGLEDRIVLLYGGNMGIAQDLDGLLRLAEREAERDIAFFFVGEGSEAARLARVARDRGLENVFFHRPVPRDVYLGMVAECDIGLIRLERELKTHNFPGKMLDYLYFGKPILASVNPGNDLRDILEGHGAGLVSETGDDDRFLEQLARLSEDDELRRRLGANGRKLIEEVFSARRAARQILAHAPSRGGRNASLLA